MLRIHVLNVSHGDAIVIEYESTDEAGSTRSEFGVVDCNSSGDNNPTLALLKARGAEQLRFVLLTHPHADHYAGLGEICDAFDGRIESFFSFPLDRSQNQLIKFAQRYAEAGKNASKSSSKGVLDIVRFLQAANRSKAWEAPVTSHPSQMNVPGFAGVAFDALLPTANVKGSLLPALMEGKVSTQATDLNDLSLALLITYAGKQVLLGADGTVVGWLAQAAKWPKSRISVRPDVVKMPHHGSAKDCAPQVLDVLFASREDAGERYAIVSASGSAHHPNASVLRELSTRGIKPYCTNLAERCGGVAQSVLEIKNPDVSPELLRSLQTFAVEPGRERPCQGDICIEITAGGQLTVVPQYQHPCGFRGEWGNLAGIPLEQVQ
ncbi:ComEC/Rec2 family competence protein [Cupriavidus pauculus]|uniref:ComEC/Rec2 family competence protein n=1 Tax=Cupriavidus pauculus TaxID=82633 RepID=UPI001FD4AD9B|nr:MBL fold metallo-hydrolase [Cupriavidus pauculus]